MTCTDCDASRYVIPSTPPLCMSRKCPYKYKINSNIPHLTCVPSDSRLYSQTFYQIATGVRQTLRVETSASDNHTTLDDVCCQLSLHDCLTRGARRADRSVCNSIGVGVMCTVGESVNCYLSSIFLPLCSHHTLPYFSLRCHQ